MPGISLRRTGGHSKGLQCVRVKTRRRHVVVASDTSHLCAHIEQGRTFPTTFHLGDVFERYNTVKKLATSMAHVVPGHDPQVLERYPAVHPDLKDWAVRLDADPKR